MAFLRCVGGRLINLDHVTMIDSFYYPEGERTILDRRLMEELDIKDKGESCIYAKMVDGNHYVIEGFDASNEVENDNSLEFYADILEAQNRPWKAVEAKKPRIIVYSNNGLVEYVITEPHIDAKVVIIRDEDNCPTKIHPGTLSIDVGLEPILDIFDNGGGNFTFSATGWATLVVDGLRTPSEDDQAIERHIRASTPSGLSNDSPVTIRFAPNDYLRVQDLAERLGVEEVHPNA